MNSLKQPLKITGSGKITLKKDTLFQWSQTHTHTHTHIHKHKNIRDRSYMYTNHY